MGLRDQNSVEWVLVMQRQVREGDSVLHSNRKRSVANDHQTLAHVLRGGQREGQLAESVLDHDFPSNSGRDVYFVRWVRQGIYRRRT